MAPSYLSHRNLKWKEIKRNREKRSTTYTHPYFSLWASKTHTHIRVQRWGKTRKSQKADFFIIIKKSSRTFPFKNTVQRQTIKIWASHNKKKSNSHLKKKLKASAQSTKSSAPAFFSSAHTHKRTRNATNVKPFESRCNYAKASPFLFSHVAFYPFHLTD